jgi:aryl-phospho-beta-D-glucosidase BglC (GH1 family)
MGEARKRNIGVLLDLHALLGGANTAEHSGTNSRQAALWGNPANLDHSRRCIEFLAREANTMEGIIGIELCNEAIAGAPGMYEWYDAMIEAVGRIDRSLPIYISDGWIQDQAIAYAKRKNTVVLGASTPLPNPVIVDHHVYYCFTDQDRNESPQQVIERVGSLLWEMDGKDGNVLGAGAAQVICGEWSCSLSDDTWAKKGTGTKEDLTKKFGQAQSTRFFQKTGGHYFWTLKMDWMDGGDWGFVAQVNSGAILVPKTLTLAKADVQNRISQAAAAKEQRKQLSYDGHVNYWSRRGSGYEHGKFASGWQQGWIDALVFFHFLTWVQAANGFGADTIGCLDLWVRKRLGECGMTGHFVWEFETGLRRGVADFYDCAGLNA